MQNTRIRELTKDEKTTFSDLNYFKNLLKIYPTGPISVVSDTFDFWGVLTKVLPQIKSEIMQRDGKLVIRPDSGDPVEIICGINEYDLNRKRTGEIFRKVYYDLPGREFHPGEPPMNKDGEKVVEEQVKGAVEILWDLFGGTVNEQGYKVLDSHIGLIYGDSITLGRCKDICERLEAKGFASTNVVFGIGSFTYQFNTRDTFGFAMKATYVEKTTIVLNPEGTENIQDADSISKTTQGFEIFKDPKTDSGLKKSAKGLLKVIQGENGLELVDQISWEELKMEDNLLTPVFKDGKFLKETTMAEIRARVKQII